ncbi:MAG: DUF72 domain-containing protein [Pseudoxanthomonas sp.]
MSNSASTRRRIRLRIGCAGWSIASAHRALFEDGASGLERYASRFDAVEINSSFHRPHRRETYERWAGAVPKNFRFSVKIPKSVSHEARLVGTGPLLDAFLGQAQGLGPKLGCLLLQLPPSLAFEARVAATFFAMLRRRWDGAIACEPRHASWFGAAADTVWQRHRIARVGADPALCDEARHSAGIDGLRYWRWHGSPRVYYSAYDEETLQAMAKDVFAGTSGSGPTEAEAWVIFDNTANGHAVPNALRFGQIAGRIAMGGASRSTTWSPDLA